MRTIKCRGWLLCYAVLPKLTSESFQQRVGTEGEINKHETGIFTNFVKFLLLRILYLGCVSIAIGIRYWSAHIGILVWILECWIEVVLFVGSTAALVCWHWYWY